MPTGQEGRATFLAAPPSPTQCRVPDVCLLVPSTDPEGIQPHFYLHSAVVSLRPPWKDVLGLDPQDRWPKGGLRGREGR